MADHVIKIESLQGEHNYNAWRVQISDYLNELGLGGHIDGSTQLSTATDAAAWRKSDAKALRQIRMRVAKDIIVYVQDASTAKEAWDTLAETFRPAGAIGIVTVRRKLYRAQCPEGGDIEEHLRRMREWNSELNSLGQKLADGDFSLTILTSLPESWDSFIRSIDVEDLQGTALTPARISPAKLIARILQENKRREARNQNDTDDSAVLLAHKSRARCFRCDKRGHLAQDCNAKHPAKHKHRRKRPPIEDSSSSSSDSETDGDNAALVTDNMEFIGTVW
ncbi:hypothetical protein EXIGLDRAFT_831224 [Exidia glandulosa HHB12029]|uniref:CCHC-type domain-containing protein n=1 Tax=Exidia glandulosa HHB12029 TaxID=1314781 RepID=A0A165MWG2_EXIGL|nr:hypothetical protein EXIGLDRAFT_831224 [Exidia glandulosa HHB12029]